MKQKYWVPNIITAFGLACGLFVIFKINMIEPGSGTYEVVNSSALLLLLAAFADFMDGAAARVLKAESEFGFMFDSLSDAVSFGVAPVVLMLKSLSLQQASFLSFLAATGCMIYALCGILRLVRFNVKKLKIKGDAKAEIDDKKYFTGLPITAAAAGLVSANLLLFTPYFVSFFNLTPTVRAYILCFVPAVIGYLMICRWKFPSLKSLHCKLPSFHLIILVMIVAIVMLYGVLHYFPLVLAFIVWGYVAVSLVLSLVRKLTGKKFGTLQDFDPEHDDDDERL